MCIPRTMISYSQLKSVPFVKAKEPVGISGIESQWSRA